MNNLFLVQAAPCATCIYHRDSPLDLKKLEAEIADRYGGFSGYRICHHSDSACCRGFWNRHKDEFALGQVSQRLKLVTEVKHNLTSLNKRKRANGNPAAKEKLHF